MNNSSFKCPPEGSPHWMATFANMMSLLKSFCVLLSFATMDVVCFKKMADFVIDAFGVQRDVHEQLNQVKST